MIHSFAAFWAAISKLSRVDSGMKYNPDVPAEFRVFAQGEHAGGGCLAVPPEVSTARDESGGS